MSDVQRGSMEAMMHRYIAGGLDALNRMETASRQARSVSDSLLLRLMRENENTEYGRRYHFDRVHSYEDYARLVPLSEYSDYEPYILRMIIRGETNLITSRKICYYAHTSGTTGASRMIPRCREELDILFSEVFQRAFALCDKALREREGKGLSLGRGLNVMESHPSRLPDGTPHGAISETLLVPEDEALYNVLPEALIYPPGEFDRRHLKMLFAVRERHLSFLMSTFSPTLHDMIQYLRNNWQALCEDLERGSVRRESLPDGPLGPALEKHLTPDPERAEEIRRIMRSHGDDAFVPLLWPDLRLVACVGTASFAPFIERLRPFLGPRIRTDLLGYVSSEATIAAQPDEDRAEYMLLPYSGFYEFLPVEEADAGRTLRLHELIPGQDYEVVLTNLSGLYRYRIGDVIRVTGYRGECPLLVFSYRKSQLVNMYGEKMNEQVLQAAVDALAKETGVPIVDYSLWPDRDSVPGRYVVLLESERDIPPDRWPDFAEILSRLLCEAHESYRSKMVQKIMRPLQVRFVQPQTYALWRDLKVLGGASPNQIKPLRVLSNQQQQRFFFGLLCTADQPGELEPG